MVLWLTSLLGTQLSFWAWKGFTGQLWSWGQLKKAGCRAALLPLTVTGLPPVHKVGRCRRCGLEWAGSLAVQPAVLRTEWGKLYWKLFSFKRWTERCTVLFFHLGCEFYFYILSTKVKTIFCFWCDVNIHCRRDWLIKKFTCSPNKQTYVRA